MNRMPTERALSGAFPAVTDLPVALRQELALAQVLRAPAGTVLFEEGGPCRTFPLLLAGTVRVAKASPEGRELVLYRIQPGQFCLLTTSCLLGNSQYPARGVAETDATLVAVSPDLFHRMLASHTGFRASVFGLFAERLSEMMQLVEEVAFRQLDCRLASLLANRAPQVLGSHQMLADELGSVRVVVSRLLREFEERGWVTLGREHIVVEDAYALRRFGES
jgi:CRP/FNR family transcriptional regulator